MSLDPQIPVADADQRERALDPQRSFIVQAPAGSGKTELLIQRYLVLLARVEAPEEIVAITFTRKAAGEMRDRVLQALAAADSETAPSQPHQRRTWELARAARQRDALAGWDVRYSPGRLRIQTIDSLCASLTRQMPITSGFGAQPEVIEDAAPLYLEAARRTLAHLDDGGPWSPVVGRVLLHLDNDMASAEGLLASMLQRRDQWLRHLASRSSERIRRQTLEAALAGLTLDALETLRASIPRETETELLALARYAADNLAQAGAVSEIGLLLGLDSLPDTGVDVLPRWRALAELLLTKKADVRAGVNATVGFPAPGKERDPGRRKSRAAHGTRMHALLATLAAHPELAAALHLTRLLPPPTYNDAQWEVVDALTQLLPLAVAELEVLFRSRGQVDFTAMSQAAVRALGPEDDPTDLALALDYRIKHLLVDEFQDTSQAQYELLARLTAGWVPADGHSLFVVGDPMQSIYRFREAEVALYLRARREGIGSVPLEPLTLCVNFRSQAGLVEWVNASFQRLLPEVEDLASGAVPFAASVALHPGLPGPGVRIHPQLGRDRAREAKLVGDLVLEAQSQAPGGRIAILVRSRSHLVAIAPALKQLGLRFQAIDIEGLGERPVVRDLQALTLALLHPADRVAWLAVLRAPWCGLTLADLERLAGHDHSACVWDLIDRPTVLERLSEDGRARLIALRERLRPCVAQRRREPLRRWIEGAWLALGGPAATLAPADLDDAAMFLGLLDELEEGGDLPDRAALAQRVADLYAQPDPGAEPTLQLMTIHKAKGLEFDTVILPGLGYSPRADAPSLLRWLERPRPHGGSDLLLAPIRERAQDGDPIYDYLAHLDARQARYEDGRLLYVAATRARSRLHLIGHVEPGEREIKPASRSLLQELWPVAQAAFQGLGQGVDPQTQAAAPPSPLHPAPIRRFPADWLPPLPPPATVPSNMWSAASGDLEQVEFSWASETARHVGTVVHRWLQTVAEQGIARWSAARVAALHGVFARDLRRLGVPESELAAASPRVASALTAVLEDERARWILSPHAQACTEWRLTGVLDGEVVNVAIDRSFVDAQGTRWIVDYKTGTHQGGDLTAFLDREQERYRAQLERYARLLQGLESRPVRMALYFPLLKAWREWS